MRVIVLALVTVVGLLAPSHAPSHAAVAAPAPVGREHLLTLADLEVVYPDLADPTRIVMRSPLFAPRGCDDRGQVVRGTSRIFGGVSPDVTRSEVTLIDQTVVRLATKAEARAVVQRYRWFSRHCVGNVRTDDGEGGKVILKNRAWLPPRVGDQSAGMLIGWLQSGSIDWRRVLVSRVGRTVSVLDVSAFDTRPRRRDLVALGELAAERLR